MSRPQCALCGRPCVPLADYDAPICIDCDDRMTTVLDVARDLERLTVPPVEPADPIVPHSLFDEIRDQLGRKTA